MIQQKRNYTVQVKQSVQSKCKTDLETSIGEDPLLREAINTMDGHDFEYFCADLLRKNGFDKVEVTKGSGENDRQAVSETKPASI